MAEDKKKREETGRKKLRSNLKRCTQGLRVAFPSTLQHDKTIRRRISSIAVKELASNPLLSEQLNVFGLSPDSS